MDTTETKALIKQVAQEAAEQAVSNALTRLGFDDASPIEVQKDMAALREMRGLIEDPEVQADLTHLRRWRRTMDAVQSRGVLTVITLLITGAAATFWLGFKNILRAGGAD